MDYIETSALQNTEKKYCVYRHTTPVNKYYFGITCHSDNVNLRWSNGLGYRTQTVFFHAIIKYGWDNIKHEILEENLTLDEAINREKYYIEKYKTNVSQYGHRANGYNMTVGGNAFPINKYIKEKSGNSVKKPVKCYNINGEYIRTYNSIKEAADDNNVSTSAIYDNIQGHTSVCNKKYRFSYGNSELNEMHNKLYERQVFMFDLCGNYITSYNSCREASRSIVGDNSAASIISSCARGERGSFHQFVWSYSNIPVLLTRAKSGKRAVDMFDLKDRYIKTFESISAAKREVNPKSKTSSCIIKCCNGEKKSAYGYKWKYHDDDIFRIKAEDGNEYDNSMQEGL